MVATKLFAVVNCMFPDGVMFTTLLPDELDRELTEVRYVINLMSIISDDIGI
jgi:hypothetical protein